MPASNQPSTILIIDDNVDMIRLLSGMLKDQGQTLFATSGMSGIQLAHQRKPHLILLDVEMPEMNGYEVCRKLKSNLETRDCAIIFVTAASSMESEIAALDAGAVDFITKPLNPAVVRARVRTHLKLQHNSAALALLVNKDSLTGLFNRRYFEEQLEEEFRRHRRQNLPLGLAFIDIDYFKAYNDNFGHQEGDICLKKVAAAINASTRRPGEIVARYGGEEFVVILPGCSSDDVQKYGEWLCQNISNMNLSHQYSAVASHITVSVGVTSIIPSESDSTYKIIANADSALYQAKAAGRNCVRIILEK